MKNKFIKLLFYHQYAWQEKVGNADIAPLSTITWMSFATMLVFSSTASLLSLLFPCIKYGSFNGDGAVLLFIGLIIYFFLLEFRYDYKRMVQLAKVKVGKNGKKTWIICSFVIPALEPLIVCVLWDLNNNGIISLR